MVTMATKQDPSAVLDWGTNWSAWLGTDTISTSTWSVTETSPVGATALTLATSTHDATTTTIWLSGGALEARYSLALGDGAVLAFRPKRGRSPRGRCRRWRGGGRRP
jgi:hypothetical protein